MITKTPYRQLTDSLDHSTLLDKMMLTQSLNQYPSDWKAVKIAAVAAAVKTVPLLR